MIKKLPWPIDEIETIRNNRYKINELVDAIELLQEENKETIRQENDLRDRITALEQPSIIRNDPNDPKKDKK